MAEKAVVRYLLGELEAGKGDVTLVVGEGDARRTLMAHHVLLCRADYFLSALESCFREGQTRTVELPDVCPKIMQLFLRRLYGQSLASMRPSLRSVHDPDSDQRMTAEQLFEVCQLCERFLAPDDVAEEAYDTYAMTVRKNAPSLGTIMIGSVCPPTQYPELSAQQFIDIFGNLVGKRILFASIEKHLLPGFRAAVEKSGWNLDEGLAAIVDAHSKQVCEAAQAILWQWLVRRVTFGENLADVVARAAEHGAVKAAVALLSKLASPENDDKFIEWLEKERTTLHNSAARLPNPVFQYLKQLYAVKGHAGLIAVVRKSVDKFSVTARPHGIGALGTGIHSDHYVKTSTVRKQLGKLDVSELSEAVAAKLSRDIEEASAELFAASTCSSGEMPEQEADPSNPKRQRTT